MIQIVELLLNLVIQGVIYVTLFCKSTRTDSYDSVQNVMSRYNTYFYVFVVVLATAIFFIVIKKKKIKWMAGHLGIREVFVAMICGMVPSVVVNACAFSGETFMLTYGEAIVYCAFTVVLAPVIEEVVYRDYLYSSLEKEVGIGVAIFISALVFAVVHFDIYQALYTFPMGCVFAVLYHKRGCAMSSLAHIAFNITAIILPVIFK